MDDTLELLDQIQAVAPPAPAPKPTEDQKLADNLQWFHANAEAPEYAGLESRLQETMARQHRELERAHERFRDTGESVPGYIARRSLPIASTLLNVGEASRYAAATHRFRMGQAQDEDYNTIAEYERHQQNNAQRGLGGQILSGLASIPALVGEGMLAPGIGIGARATSVGGRLLGAAASKAAQTPFMPSLYVENWIGRNQAAGRDPLSLEGLPPALAMGALQNIVLGTMGGVGNRITGDSIGAFARRTLTRAGTGIAEQQGVDLLAGAVTDVLGGAQGMETSYGVLGDLLRGRGGDALKHLVVQGVTFAAFAALHDVQHGAPKEIMRTVADSLQGRPEDPAGPKIAQLQERLQIGLDRLRQSPQVTGEQLKSIIDSVVNPPKAELPEPKHYEPYPHADWGVEPPPAPLAEPKPERPSTVPQAVHDAFSTTFPGGEWRPRGEFEAKVGGRTINLGHDAERNMVRIDFEGEKPGVPRELQAGSMDLARAIKGLLPKLKEAGQGIEYRSVDTNRGQFLGSRADFYAKMLEKAGFERAPSEQGIFAWRPKEAEPAKPAVKPWEADTEASLRSLGHPAKEAKQLVKDARESGREFKSPEEAIQAINRAIARKAKGLDPWAEEAPPKPSLAQRMKQKGREAQMKPVEQEAKEPKPAHSFETPEEAHNDFEAHGLTPEEQVMYGLYRAGEGSYKDIANHPEVIKAYGKKPSYQTVKNIVDRAHAKMGFEGSAFDAETGRRMDVRKGSFGDGLSKPDRLEIEQKLNDLLEQFANKKISEEKFNERYGKLQEEVLGRSAGSEQPPPVRPEAASGVPGRSEPGGPETPPFEAPRGGQVRPEPAAPEGGEAPGNELMPGPPPSIQQMAQEIHASGDPRRWQEFKDALERNFPGEAKDKFVQSLGNQSRKEVEKRLGGARIKQMEGAADAEALDRHMIEEAIKHEQAQAATDPEVLDGFQQGLRAGLEAGTFEEVPKEARNAAQKRAAERESERLEAEGEGGQHDLPAGSDIGEFPFGPSPGGEPVGGAERRTIGQEPAKPKEAPFGFMPMDDTEFSNTSAKITNPDAPPGILRRIADGIKDRITRTRQWLRQFGGEMFPKSHDQSQDYGNKMVAFASHPELARLMGPLMTDKVMGEVLGTDANRKMFGTALNEVRLRYMQQAYERAGDLEAAANVGTFIGGENSPFQNEFQFQHALKDPRMQGILNRWAEHMAPVMDANFRKAQGLLPGEEINSFTQIPGLPISLIHAEPTSPKNMVVGTVAGNLRNPKLQRFKFSRQATGTGTYETDLGKIIEATLEHGFKVGSKAEMIRQGVKDGLLQWGRPAERITNKSGQRWMEFPDVNPPPGTQENRGPVEPGRTQGQERKNLFADPEIADELRRNLQVDKPWNKVPGTGLLTKATLASTVEFMYHGKNLLTFLFKPGVNPIDLFREGYKVAVGDMDTRQRLADLAGMGSGKPEGAESGFLWGGKTDPTTWASKGLDFIQRTMRLVADNAFNRLAAQGRVEGSEANRRNFENQLGQYNKVAQTRLISMLRETGVGPFATAASNYLMQGLRSMTLNPGVQATSAGHALGLRAEFLARLALVPAVVALVNYFAHGRLDGDDQTPFGSIKLGREGGRTQYLPLTDWTGLTRGARTMGLMALMQGNREHKPVRESATRGAHDIFHAVSHIAMGPVPSFVNTTLTGENAIGMRVAPKENNRNDLQNNFLAALANANPIFATAFGFDRPQDQLKASRWWRLLGPFGPRESRR